MIEILTMGNFQLKEIEALILDMDGVIWKDDQPIGDLPKMFEKITQLDLRVILATNNSTRTVNQYIDKTKSLGIQLKKWQIITSSQTVVDYLQENFPGGSSIFVVGEEGLVEALSENGFKVGTGIENISAVVVGMDRNVTYEKLKLATLLIRRGAAFIGSNSDKTFPTPEGLVPGAGSILSAIETATGVHPIVTGKPDERIYRIALDRLKSSPQETLVVGDRLETDIYGAQICGCRTALVLSGVTTKDQLITWNPKPDIIADNLSEIVFDILS